MLGAIALRRTCGGGVPPLWCKMRKCPAPEAEYTPWSDSTVTDRIELSPIMLRRRLSTMPGPNASNRLKDEWRRVRANTSASPFRTRPVGGA